MSKSAIKLALVLPCYNESEMLPITVPRIQEFLQNLVDQGEITDDSFAVMVDDGSHDTTWSLIEAAANQQKPSRIRGLRLAANVGHQGAMLAGLDYVTGQCDAAISIDADLQHDIGVIPTMLARLREGSQLVLGVRDSRDVDSFFKGATAVGFYRIMRFIGVKLVVNHADFRLMSDLALRNLKQFSEVQLFLRGLPPMLHRNVATVTYVCGERQAGQSKYSTRKMLSLAWNGITSFSTAPLRLVTMMGGLVFLFSLMMIAYSLLRYLMGEVIPGWASVVIPVYMMGGMVMLSIGVVGEYIGKLFMEVKHRPRFLVETIVGENDKTATAANQAKTHQG